MNLFKLPKEYNLWYYLFIAVNILAFFISLNSGELLGDLELVSLYSESVLLFSTILVLFSYFFIQKFLFGQLSKIKVVKIFPIKNFKPNDSFILSRIIFLLQVGYMCFNISEGVNTAGALNIKSTSPFAFFWVLIPIDAIFTVYYVFFRESKFFKLNALVYIISNLLRGWSGVFLFILFFEWCRAYRKNKIKYSYIFFISLIGLFLYPYLLNFKWVIRSLSGGNIDLATMSGLFIETIGNRSYSELFQEGISQLVGRLQQTSILVEIIHQKDFLQSEFYKGAFLPFWSEGLPQIVYRRIFGIISSPNLGSAAPIYLLPELSFELESYNLSVGFISWFFIAPLFIPLYLLYTLILCFLSIFLIKQIKSTDGQFDSIWFAWLVYLSAGWLSQFIVFIYGILIFIFLIIISQFLARIRIKHNHNSLF